eukprot:5499566-Ditylum_brightwellii.AAC.1
MVTSREIEGWRCTEANGRTVFAFVNNGAWPNIYVHNAVLNVFDHTPTMSSDENDDNDEYDNTVGNQDEIEQAFHGETEDDLPSK